MPRNRMASGREALNFIAALLLKGHGFTLTMLKFRGGFCIRYNIEAKDTPTIVHLVKSSTNQMLSSVQILGVHASVRMK